MSNAEIDVAVKRLARTLQQQFTPPEFIPGCEVKSIADINDFTTNNGWIEAFCGQHNQQRVRYKGFPAEVQIGDFLDVIFYPQHGFFEVHGAGGATTTGINSAKVSKVFEADLGASALSVDAAGLMTLDAAGGIIVNEAGIDSDLRIEGDNQQNLFFVDAGNDRIGLYTNAPIATLHLAETYTDTTSHQALRIEQTWSPSTTSGAQFPTTLFLGPTFSTTHTPSSGFLTSFRLFAEVADSGVIGIRNVDLRSTNSGSGTVALVTDLQFRAAVNSGGGSITEYRAINIENQTVAGTNYGLVQVGAGVLNKVSGKLTVGGTTDPTAQLRVDQSSTTAAVPPILIRQADVSEEMIEFDTTIGTGNAVEAIGAKTLTTTHFVKVTLPGGSARYFPVGTIA